MNKRQQPYEAISLTNNPLPFTLGQVELLLLYIVYVTFFIAALLTKNSNFYLIIANCSILFLIAFYIISRGSRFTIRVNYKFFLFFLLVLLLACTMPISKIDPYPVVFFGVVCAYIVLLQRTAITLNRFLSFINNTYLIYLLLSVLNWIGIITLNSPSDSNTFNIGISGFNFITLFSFEGSTAQIDSYSGLVMLLNLFFGVRPQKWFFVITGLSAMLLTARMTPIVSLFAALLIALSCRTKFTALLAVIFSMGGFILLLWLITFKNFELTKFGVPIDLYMASYFITHARSMIWVEQIKVFLEQYRIFDLIFGHFKLQDFNITLLTLDGSMIQRTSNNPHNSYLFLFFHSPLLATILYLLVIKTISSTFSTKTFPIIFYILTAAFTSSIIFSLHNPVYLLTLIYLMTQNKKIKSELQTGSLNA